MNTNISGPPGVIPASFEAFMGATFGIYMDYEGYNAERFWAGYGSTKSSNVNGVTHWFHTQSKLSTNPLISEPNLIYSEYQLMSRSCGMRPHPRDVFFAKLYPHIEEVSLEITPRSNGFRARFLMRLKSVTRSMQKTEAA